MKREAGEGVWAKRLKPSRRGSISVAPCKTAKGDIAWGWHGGTDQVVVVVVGLCGCKTRGGEGGLGEKPETEPPWLGFGCTTWNGNGGCCVGVAWWPIPGGGGAVAKHEEGRGVWVKIPKPSRRGLVLGAPCGTGVGDGAWGWHGGTYEAAAAAVGSCGRKTRGGEGGWVKNPKLSHRGSVLGCNGAAEGGGGCCGVTDTPSCANLWVGMGS